MIRKDSQAVGGTSSASQTPLGGNQSKTCHDLVVFRGFGAQRTEVAAPSVLEKCDTMRHLDITFDILPH